MFARGLRPILALWLAALALLAPAMAGAEPTFPALTGRVVDAANIIPADERARLDQKLAALEAQSGRQLVVATVPIFRVMTSRTMAISWAAPGGSAPRRRTTARSSSSHQRSARCGSRSATALKAR